MSAKNKARTLALLAWASLALSASALAGELEKLSWLAGHWVTEDGAAEELWLEPRGGTMTGSFRWVFPNGRQVLEYMIIEEKAGAITFRFKHYGTDFVPWEKERANTYRVVDLASDKVVFELEYSSGNAPARYQYERRGDKLTFRGEAETGEEPLVIEFQRK